MKTQTEILQAELNKAVWMFYHSPKGTVKEFWRGKMSGVDAIAVQLKIDLSFSEAVKGAE